MYKSIYVPMFGSERDKSALEAALGLAKLFDARLDCVHIRPDPRQVIASVTTSMEAGTVLVSDELLNALIESDKNRAARAKEAFESFVRQMALPPDRTPFTLSASFRETVGDPATTVVALARFSDVTVFAPIEDMGTWGLIADTIVGAGRPVLLAPSPLSTIPAPVVTIAWKETTESARAVMAAMPLLAKARQIHVISACESSGALKSTREAATNLVTLLQGHGFPAQAECIECHDRDPGPALLERAIAQKSNLVVSGAYGRARVREFIFGGFTQFMLRQNRLPVFMQH